MPPVAGTWIPALPDIAVQAYAVIIGTPMFSKVEPVMQAQPAQQ